MSLINLHRQAVAARQEILREMEAKLEEEQRILNASIQAARNAEKAARNAEKAARNAIRTARTALRVSKPRGTRKRAPGANYEIAGRPLHLAPGATMRSVEGKRTYSRTLAKTRGRRSKAKY